MSTLTLESGGRMTLPPAVARNIGAGPLALVSHSSGHLLVAPAPAAAGVVLAGSLGSLSVADLLSFFNLFRKSGLLRFTFAGGGKELVFLQGEIVAATTTFPEEDLGETLFALGKVDRDALLRARQAAVGSGALGKILVDAGSVAAKDLWLAARVQVETIVYNLFTQATGSFVFHDDATPGDEQPRFTLSTQNLIMEGLRRVDERALFRRHIPSLDAIPVTCGKAADDLPHAEQRLLAHIAGGKLRVRELLRKGGLGEFDGLRMLHHLAEQGFVAMAAPKVEVSGELGELLGVFNGALATMHKQIHPVCPGFSQEVRLFLRDLPYPFSVVFGDCAPRDDGTLNGGR
ncbi:MAG TPA: hypothetical protein DCF93_13050, partial [Desulfuromonas sp.]|nr:hypothetical protein [Desulfuromonas sp.]